MKLSILLTAVLCTCCAYSQEFNVESYSRTFSQTVFYKSKKVKEFYIETTPWVIKGGWYQYFLTTNFTSMWSTPRSLATPYSEDIYVGAGDSYGPHWVLSSAHWWDGMISHQTLNNPSFVHHREWTKEHWRRNYNGVFAAHIIPSSQPGQKMIFAVSHGENRNERYIDFCYQNTVDPGYLIDCNDRNTWSGTTDGHVFYDHWPSYFGFLNGNWIPYSEGSDWGNTYLKDLGPLAWPSAGYLKEDNTQSSAGLRHPSSIVIGDTVFIFVKDESSDGTGGVKLIRAAFADILNPSGYETWSAGNWIPALPSGFTKERITDFFKTRGPRNTAIFNTRHNTTRFAVAKFKDTNKEYIGVEQYNVSDTLAKVAIRFSTDLVNWSDPYDIYEAKGWNALLLKYPVFLSKDGSSNTEIDKDEFYVIGVDGAVAGKGQRITKVRFQRQRQSISRAEGSDCELFAIGPVPASTTLTINKNICAGQLFNSYSIELFDVRGVIRKRRQDVMGESGYQMNIADLGMGNYFLRILSGTKQFTRQITIVR